MTDKTIHLLVAGKAGSTGHIASLLTESDNRLHVQQISSSEELETTLNSQPWGMIITRLELTDCTALELFNNLQAKRTTLPFLLIAETGGEPIVLQCIQRGIGHCILDNEESLKRLPDMVSSILRVQQYDIRRQESEDRLRESEERYLDIFDNTSDLIQCLGPDGRFLYTNKAWRATLGYSESEISDLSLPDILHPDSIMCCQDRFKRLKKGDTLSKIEFKFITKAGKTVHLAGECGSIIKNGEAISTRGIFKNVTEEKKTEQALIISENRYQSLYQNAPDIDIVVNSDGKIVTVNNNGAKILGYTPEELLGISAIDTVHLEDQDMVFNHLQQQFEGCKTDRDLEFRKTRKNGSQLWVQMRTSLIPGNSENEKNLLIVCRDITETRKLAEQLTYQASHDDLTDLINRREFERRLIRLLSEDRRSGDTHALCYLDLDQFKIINDACGHLAGDELLRQVASVMAGQVRSRDTLARLGGDEFAVLMEYCSIEQADKLANRFRKAIEDFRFHWKSRRFSIGVSIGVVPINDSINTLEQVMGFADSACYAAKDAGRNRVFIYRQDDATVEHHTGELHWASKISGALEQNRFLLYAQPIFPIDDLNNSGCYEILIRLKETNDVIVKPGSFLPSAERFNLSNKLDKWVFESTLNWFTTQHVAFNKLKSCSINLSGLSLSDESFLEFIENTLDESGFPYNKLCFEITETAAISNLVRATTFINQLKEKGCQFALDDFGSGFSSYAYLKNLPVDVIKIDGTFIRNIENNTVDRAVVKSICEISKLMNKKITAEYVESKAALEILRELDVDFVQGNYLAAPLPLALAMLDGRSFDKKQLL